MAWTAYLGVWYTVHMCSIFIEENGYGHASRRLCPSGFALSKRTARVAPSGDLDRVLPAVLSPPSHRLPLPGLRPGGGAPSTTATTSPCPDHGLTGGEERTTPALSQIAISRRPTRRGGASRGPSRTLPRQSLRAASEPVSMALPWFLRGVCHPRGHMRPGSRLVDEPLHRLTAPLQGCARYDPRQVGGRSPAWGVCWEEAMGGRPPRRRLSFQRVGRHEVQRHISCPRGAP
jgi:hypothetical protein